MIYHIGNMRRYVHLAKALAEYLSIEYKHLQPSIFRKQIFSFDDLIYYDFFVDNIAGGLVIGPDQELARAWDSKSYQISRLSSIIPMPKYKTYSNLFNLLSDLDNIKNTFSRYVISADHGFSGIHSIACDNTTKSDDIFAKLGYRGLEGFKVSEYLEKSDNISVYAITCKSRTQVISLIDKHNDVDGITWVGSKHPSEMADYYYAEIHEFVERIGKMLRSDGYFGIFSIDLILVENSLFFSEINPRKDDSAICISPQMELELGYPLSYVEYLVATKNELPFNIERTLPTYKWEICLGKEDDTVKNSPGDERQLIKSGSGDCICYHDSNNEGELKAYKISVESRT